MTILSDRQIKALCTRPTHSATVSNWDVREVHAVGSLWVDSASGDMFNPAVSDIAIRQLNREPHHRPMIEPFVPDQVKTRPRFIDYIGVQQAIVENRDHPDMGQSEGTERIISYGLTSYGYDVRLGRKFKIFTNINSTVIDPMNMSDDCYVDFEGDVCIIPPHSYALGHTIETFHMPKDVVAVCLGKSTYARAGCAINVTPIEPGFIGQVVIEIANQTPLPMKVYANMGIAQFMFHRGEPCMVSYADRGGKYQGQSGVQTAKV